MKIFEPEGIRTWRDSNLKRFEPEGIRTFRYSNLKVFEPECIRTWRYSVFEPEGINVLKEGVHFEGIPNEGISSNRPLSRPMKLQKSFILFAVYISQKWDQTRVFCRCISSSKEVRPSVFRPWVKFWVRCRSRGTLFGKCISTVVKLEPQQQQL